MAVEVVGFEMIQGPVETVTEGGTNVLYEKENDKLDQGPGPKEPIKFGSHGDEPIKEGNGVSDANFPKDAVDEWPAPKQIHYIYFVRCRSYDDPKIKAKIDQADKEIQRKKQARFQITEALKAKRSERAELISQIRALKDGSRQFKAILDEKRKEIEPLQQALGKLRNTNNTVGRGNGLCSSEEELNDFIHGLQYRIQHESIPLSEEKQLLREIKQLEATREKVVANAAMRAKIQDSLGQREDIQDQVKLIGGDLDGVRKEKQVLQTKIKQIEDTLKAVDDDINSLSEELKAVTQKRDKAYESIQQLRKQRNEGNAYFYQSRTVLNKARELAAKKDIKALEELSRSEVENFLSLWSSNKAFREDYEKRILPSLDSRQLSRDGRMRNPDEKPLVVMEEPAFYETQTVAKASVKELKEDSKSSSQDTLPTQKAQKETKNKATHPQSTLEHNKVEDREIPGLEELPNDTPAKDNEVDSAKLKELKREEEIAKAKQAIERKKKLAEKAAAKAAIKSQKEAEKKLKEREKKAKKKASAASALATDPEEPPVEVVSEAAEQEIVEAPVEAKQKVQMERVLKGNTIRPRNRSKGPDSVPKVVLKRKKSTNYWIWVAPAAAVLVLLFLVLGYYYLF